MLCLGLAAFPIGVSAPSPCDDAAAAVEEVKAFRLLESRRVFERMDVARRAEAAGVQPSQHFDIEHYDIAIKVDPASRTIAGTVTMSFEPTQSLDRVKMRLHPNLKATGSTLDGAPIKTGRDGANLTFKLKPALQPGQAHTLTVQYSGYPVVTGGLGGGMMFDTHAGVPSATTLSEPFDSYAWWPCVDDVLDKATMEMHLTVPAHHDGRLQRDAHRNDLQFGWHDHPFLARRLPSPQLPHLRQRD